MASSPVSIVGTAEANSVVELFKGETSLGTVTADNLGAFTFSSVALAEGDNSFTATATDAANNKSPASTPPVVITLDTTAPAAPAITNTFTTFSSSPVTLEGTAEANSVVELFKGETSLGTVTADNLGAFTFSSVALAEGDNSFTAKATDQSGNTSVVSSPVVITLDTTAPAAPVITNSTATVASSPVSIVGTAEANSVVELFKGETSLGTVTADNLGAFTFSSVALAEGDNSFTATATDAANNKSPASLAVVITLNTPDTTPPAAPAITNSTATVVSSPVSIVGTAEANSVVELFKGETSLGTATADNLGAFTFSSVALAEGDNSFTAKATDRVGNTSPASPAVVITLDTTAPAAPVITNATSTVASFPVSIVGTAEANSVVELFKGETSLGTVTADNLGAFTFSSVALAEGANSFTATATDAANNKSPASLAVVITLDTTPPEFNTYLDGEIINISTYETEWITAETCSDANPTVINAVESGDTLVLGTAGSYVITYTCTDFAGNESSIDVTYNVLPPITITFDSTQTHTNLSSLSIPVVFSVDVTDFDESDVTFVNSLRGANFVRDGADAKNYNILISPVSEGEVTITIPTDSVYANDVTNDKATFSIIYDTTPPAAPAISNSTATVVSSPVSIVGTAEANSVVELFKGETSLGTVTADNLGAFTFSSVALAEGDNSFTATATDAANNKSPASLAVVITLNTPDTTPPAAPAITNTTSTVASSPVSIVGTAEANSVVELFKGETSLGTVTADNLGAFTFSSVALAEGANSFTATATDAANNKSPASLAVVITLDTTAPAAPVITNSTSTVVSSPVSIVGTAEANSVVELFKGETSLGTVTADNLGAFTFSSVALAEGANSFTTTATDAANNKSPASLAVVITLNTPDTTPPAAPAITNATATVASSPVSIVGTAEANSVVELFKGETSLGTATADNLGAFTFSSVALAEGANSFTTTATDAANNKSPASLAVVITLDTTAPAAPAITNTFTTFSSSPVSIVGTAEANSVVELFKGETSLGTVTADNLGAFTFSSVALAEGANSFTATATDAANNKSPASTPAVVITLDTTAPAAPAITNTTSTVVSSPVSIVGTAEANSIVELFKGETSLGTVTADNLGAFTFSSVALAEGANSFTATATDAANNKSPASTPAVVITLDTTAPAAPVVTNTFTTFSSSPVSIVGTAEANSVVELFKGETSLGTVTADNLGAFTFSSVALAEGANSFTATATDAANNKSVVSPAVVITLDTTAPAAPAITNATATVASSPVSIVGTAEANSVVELFKGETSLGTATADNLGAFTFSSVALAEGANSFTAKATDAANNKSPASTPAVVITLDTTAPAAPAITNTFTTFSSSPVSIVGTAEANSVVELFKGETSLGTATADNLGAFTFSSVALAEGANSFTAKATDQSGNTSVVSPAVVITLDTTAPAAPVITNTTATVASSPVSIVGTAEANSVVELFKGETSLGTVTADNLGAFTFSSVALAEGANSFTTTATDAANNKSPASLAVVITLDTTAPAAPVITNTFTTFSSSPVSIVGTAEANSVVELFKGETSLGTVTADNLGAFTFSSVALAEGANSFTAKATDAASNVSPVRTFTFTYISLNPSFSDAQTSYTIPFGDALPTLICTDLNQDRSSHIINAVAPSFDSYILGTRDAIYTCTDPDSNSVTHTAAITVVPANNVVGKFHVDRYHYNSSINLKHWVTFNFTLNEPLDLGLTSPALLSLSCDTTLTTDIVDATGDTYIDGCINVTQIIKDPNDTNSIIGYDLAIYRIPNSGPFTFTIPAGLGPADSGIKSAKQSHTFEYVTGQYITLTPSPVDVFTNTKPVIFSIKSDQYIRAHNLGTSSDNGPVTSARDTSPENNRLFSHVSFFNTFTITSNPASDGTVTLSMPSISNIGPFGNSTKPLSFSYVYDTTDPTFATFDSIYYVPSGDTSYDLPTIRCEDANTDGSFDADYVSGTVVTTNLNLQKVTYSCTDKAGNSATAEVSFQVRDVADTTPPAAPTITNTTATVTSSPVSIVGTAENNSVVELFKGGTSVGTTTASSSGAFSFSGVALAEGANSFTAKATDAANNKSPASLAVVITLDTTAPAAPVITNTFTTFSSSPVSIVGTAENNSVVELFKGGTSVGTTTASSSGAFSFSVLH